MTAAERSGQGGEVIAAFPATGKTYVAGRDARFADSDSSHFAWVWHGFDVRERHPDWPANYLAHVRRLFADGKTVLCSTHQEVRDALVAAEVPFTLVYPARSCRTEYLERMRERGSDERLLTLIDARWDDLIASCEAQQGCEHIVLPEGCYLSYVLS